MSCLEVIRDHRTVRAFAPDPVPEEDLVRMVQAAQRASTDATAQMYTLIRVRDMAVRQKIADLAGGQRHVLEAPEFFVVCADVYRLRRLLEYRGVEMGTFPTLGLLFGVVDAALAAQNLALAAESMGYGIAFIGGIQNQVDELVDLLRLPPGVYPVVGLCVGRPAHRPDLRPRLPREAVWHENVYRDYTPEDLQTMYNAMAPIASTGDWLSVLRRYFAREGVMERRERGVRETLRGQGFLDKEG